MFNEYLDRAMKTDENNRITPGDRWEPGDVYMMLSPAGMARDISIDDRLYKSFGHFVQDYTYSTLEELNPPYANSFFVHYRFNDPGQIPAWREAAEPLQAYRLRLEAAIRKQGLKPVNTLRLYPAIYCYRKGLDPLRPENSERELGQMPDYRRAVSRYSGREQLLGINTYTGIETDRGVLLFDNTPEGRKLQKRYKDFLADKFFDPRLDITFFRTIDVIPDEVQRARINPVIDLDRLYSSEPEPFGVLSADCYTDMTEIGIHTERERYDMSATRENFVRFARMDKGSDIFLSEHTYNIACLLHLASPECTDPMIRDKFPNFFSYRDWFDNLAERFTKATTETEKQQAMALIRQRADHILRHDYPNLRRPPVPAPKEQTETAVTSVGKPARQLPDVAKKLAAHSKKKTGLKP